MNSQSVIIVLYDYGISEFANMYFVSKSHY